MEHEILPKKKKGIQACQEFKFSNKKQQETKVILIDIRYMIFFLTKYDT